MPDKRKHRGPHPNDEKLFAERWHKTLRTAVEHQSLLRTLGYAETAALKLVGDRFRLTERQRRVVRAAACSDDQLTDRRIREVNHTVLAGEDVYIDGFNLLITLESALSGGYLFRGRDGLIRDLASVHGTYRRVEETEAAIVLLGEFLHEAEVRSVSVYLDQPVSNSGRLKTRMLEMVCLHEWNWAVELHYNPDAELIKVPALDGIVLSADALVLDGARRWFGLVEGLLPRLGAVNLVDLGGSSA